MKKWIKVCISIASFILLALVVVFYVIPYPIEYYIVGMHP